MIVREEPFQLRMPRDSHRSPGLHLSSILRDLAFKTGVLDAKYNTPDNTDDLSSTTMMVGLAWEDFLAAHQHPEITYHPGELKLDGIAMSPDGISIADDEDYAEWLRVDVDSYILHEFKATRKSSRDFKRKLEIRDKKTLLWLWQIAAYRHALNRIAPKQACLSAKLHVMFMNGDYSRDGDGGMPQYRIYILDFSEQDLANNWEMVISHRDEMAAEMEGGI